MGCPELFKYSPGAFFAPAQCGSCPLLKTERTTVRSVELYYCQNIDAYATYQATVLSVIDGDTLRVRGLGTPERVRLLGIDAPESQQGERADQQCTRLGVDFDTLKILAKLAMIHLWSLCPKGTSITLQTTASPRDEYYRILAGAFQDDMCVNHRMVEDGYAFAYQGYSDWQDYADLEQTAQNAGRGIWGDCAESYYVTTARSYHRPGCYYAQWGSGRVNSREEAAAMGFNPCSSCLPDYRRP